MVDTVHFSVELKNVYGSIIDAINKFSLEWAYSIEGNISLFKMDSLEDSDTKCLTRALNCIGIKE
eukprot:9491779-Ditylum_brightwellii.AAC.1